MNKAELVAELAKHFGDNKAEAARALNAVVETISELVARGEKVSITGFGAFERVYRDARLVRNPATGERKQAEETYVPRFRAGTELKAKVAAAAGAPQDK